MLTEEVDLQARTVYSYAVSFAPSPERLVCIGDPSNHHGGVPPVSPVFIRCRNLGTLRELAFQVRRAYIPRAHYATHN